MEKLIEIFEFALKIHGRGESRPESRSYLCEHVNAYWCQGASVLPDLLTNASISRFLNGGSDETYAWRMILAAPFSYWPHAARPFSMPEVAAIANGLFSPDLPPEAISLPDAVQRHLISHRRSMAQLEEQAIAVGFDVHSFRGISSGLRSPNSEQIKQLSFLLRTPEREFYSEAQIKQLAKWGGNFPHKAGN